MLGSHWLDGDGGDAVAPVSRRQLFRGGAMAIGGLAGMGLLDPASALAEISGAAPNQ